jgi:spore maturation protein CgeB
MAARITKYLNNYVRRGICLIYMSSFYFWSPPLARKMRKNYNLPPDIGFTLFSPIKGRIDSLTVYIYKAETCTNILRYNTCMSSSPCPAVGYNKTVYQCFHPLPVPMAARITKYLNNYVRRGICLIYMSSFYFWSPPLARIFSPIKGRIDSLTVYIYKAETCTNILRYNTCMSSSPGDRKWTKIEP